MLALCDLDHTLLDRAGAYERWARRAVREGAAERASVVPHPRGWREDLVTEICALAAARTSPRGITEYVTGALGWAGSAQEREWRFRREFAEEQRCATGVREGLTSLRAAGWRVGIVTNGPALQKVKISVSGLAPLIDVACISEIEGCEKPGTELLERAARAVGVSLSDCWLIGDTASTDILAAVRAGIPSVWVSHGASWKERGYSPTYTVDTCAAGLELMSAGPVGAGPVGAGPVGAGPVGAGPRDVCANTGAIVERSARTG